MDPIEQGNHERAWNDPPKFAFNASTAGTSGSLGGRRRLLNKRVPVPIGPAGNATPPLPVLKPSDIPPTTGSAPARPPTVAAPTAQPRVNSLHDTKTKTLVDTLTKEVDIGKSPEEILGQVELALNNSLQNISVELKHNIRDEISKRIHMMRMMWLDGKLNVVVQKRMLSLAEALNQQEYETAWSLHQGLIVDYTSLCTPWMVGIKTLISECRNQSNCKTKSVLNSTVLNKNDEKFKKNKCELEVNSEMAIRDISISEEESSVERKCEDGAITSHSVSDCSNNTQNT